MVVSLMIIAVSTILFGFWFRYACLLILSTRANVVCSKDTAAVNRLSFRQVSSEELMTAADGDLRAIQSSLYRDYRVVTSLLRQMAKLQVGGDSLEHLMLRADFRIMELTYRISKSRAALAEMSVVVEHLAHRCGERSAALARM